jgi:carbon-monoxide dehydrogenase medium subunit
MESIAYFQPQKIEEYLELMKSQGKDGTLIAGGTNLIPEMRDGIKSPKVLVDVGCMEGLSGIDLGDGEVTVGAATTITEIAKSPLIQKHCPILAKAASELGNHLTRNRATIGGNLANASPCADTAPPLLAMEAAIHISDGTGKARAIPVEKFFLGYRLTQLGPGDVMTHITIPVSPADTRGGFTKLGLRKAASICVASVGLTLMKKDDHIAKARIAFGSVAPQPIRAYRLEEFLEGKTIEDGVLAECDEVLKKEIAPISDIRGTAGYRHAATGAILKRNLLHAWA